MRELLLGLGLGLGAGLSPGALLSLVITASLRGGFPAGLRIACVPLLSDLPIVLLTIGAVGALPGGFLRVLSLAGGAYVVFLGVQGLRDARTAEPPRPGDGAPAQVLRGVVVNMLNPHPWLFWATVGAPLFVAAWDAGPAGALAFVLGFYLVLVGSKVALAGLVGAGRHRVGVRGYRLLLAASSLLLAGAGAVLVSSGIAG
ncbi:lysine transporter LysE [Acrocarpospora phusangensis]|uniref:Lysine transporter LysE n=1 Tax=Acrocarpospora phusangensis TaxID=1070424 RepID=A0A919QDI5_9ACTN|nr:LysE family transporter [Acrocarpospora phusangensis]GIH26876.1 lysine transporter LysE [Acrocarpospora phusangensis]